MAEIPLPVNFLKKKQLNKQTKLNLLLSAQALKDLSIVYT